MQPKKQQQIKNTAIYLGACVAAVALLLLPLSGCQSVPVPQTTPLVKELGLQKRVPNLTENLCREFYPEDKKGTTESATSICASTNTTK